LDDPAHCRSVVFDDLEMSGFGYQHDHSMILPVNTKLDEADQLIINRLKEEDISSKL